MVLMQKRFFILASIIGLAFIAGIFYGRQYPNSAEVFPDSKQGIRAVREGGYKYINPLLDYEGSEEFFIELKPFKVQLQQFVDARVREVPGIDFVSIYFRDLNNGPWFGINETVEFSPASLLKVPLMLAYYKHAEDDPGILQKTIEFKKSPSSSNVIQTLPPSVKLQDGESYTIEDLIYRMVVYSDNDAHLMLLQYIDDTSFKKIYSDFGLSLIDKDTIDTKVNVKTYAGFFRMLFNASYISNNYSEKALELLAKTEFQKGLVAGVPEGTQVAHKFGERSYLGSRTKQLHDCGIVYYPEHPYLLCVMSRGEDADELAAAIREVSNLIFQEVNAQYMKQ
jgi:beta-lactamase class A